MGGYFQKKKEKMVMLNRGKKIIYTLLLVIVCLYGCLQKKRSLEEKENLFREKAISIIGNKKDYSQLYNQMIDTLENWLSHKLIVDTVYDDFTNEQIIWKYELDSFFCINTLKKRIIGALYQKGESKKKISMDDIHFFYGEKIDGKWYFWTGATIGIYRKIYPNHDQTKPLTYAQLHEQAIKEVFGGYLDKNGEINDEWFVFHFEGPGWGKFEEQGPEKDWYLKGRRFKTRKEYFETLHKE
jgi:hypothetical protein